MWAGSAGRDAPVKTISLATFRGGSLAREIREIRERAGACAAVELRTSALIFVREYVLQPNFEPVENRCQFAKREVMLPALQPVQGRMGYSGFAGKLSVRESASLPPEELCQLPIQISPH